jgi:ParB-like chromosome segregation protein Spo0J
MAAVKFAFEEEAQRLPIDSVLPVRTIPESVRRSKKYRRIEASLREIGLIEPIVVYPQKGARGESPRFIILDGHLRHEILRAAGEKEILCLVATDDEGFTYNHKVNQASPIQEHFMILKAIESGVSEERIANVLSLDLGTIRKKRDLLDGICPEAVELLKNHRATPGAIRELRRVLPMRQIDMAGLMIASRNFSVAYAKALVLRTPPEQLVHPESTKGTAGPRPEDLSRIEHETQTIEADFRRLEESHGKNMLNLVVAVGYVRRLLDNAGVLKYLSRKYRDLLAELERVVEGTDLAGATVGGGGSPPGAGTPPESPA